MKITFEERCRLIPFMAEALDLGLVTEADKEQVRSSQDGLIDHLYDCERRVLEYRAKKAQADNEADSLDDDPARKGGKKNGRFGIRALPGDAIKETIFKELDFGPLWTALQDTVPTVRRYWALQKEIKQTVEYHVYAAFWLGWQAAQYPEEWLFSDKSPGGAFSCVSPYDTFHQKMEALGYGWEEVWGALDDDSNDLASDILHSAQKKAFATGWQSQADPSWIIFWREKEDK